MSVSTLVTSLPGLVAEAAAARPDAVAVIDGDRETTYAELVGRINEVAERLVARGIGAGDTVAIGYPRGLGYPVAVLGVLAAGATCLPVNVDEPAARLERIVRGAGARATLTPDGLHELPGPVGAKPGGAFVFPTSGSTGEPKLVALPHSAALVGIRWAQRELGIGVGDRHLFRTSPSFVTILRQVIWPLATGGTCVVLPDGQEGDLGLVARTLATAAITVSTFIPSALRVTLQQIRPGSCPALRHILCGAEPLPEATRAEVFAKLDATLHTLYALTEAPMVTHHVCSPDDRGPAPLGTPVDGALLRVVTPDGHLAGPGEEGQIHVGGPVVAAGYLVDGRLDRTRFVADIWGGTGELLPTGDFARVGADGVSVTYSGRVDDFVKVRGYRVSPGEVEAALARHPEVTSVVVVATERTAGVSALSAFVVAEAGSDLAEPALRTFLDGELPRHLLPDRIVCLDALPRLPNGKVDRAGLLALPVDGSGYTAPRDDFEASICALWQEILGVERVGIHDKFRDLGGDSLGAVELAFRLDEMLDTELPSEIFSNAATVAELAAACRAFLSYS